jgi:nucleoside-diphosphate-sugar epimerase
MDQIFQPWRRGDADVILTDISRIEALTGWQPKVPFAGGLAELMELG